MYVFTYQLAKCRPQYFGRIFWSAAETAGTSSLVISLHFACLRSYLMILVALAGPLYLAGDRVQLRLQARHL